MKIYDCVADKRAQPFARGKITLVDFAKTDRFCAKRLEDSVVLSHLGLQFF
jgi:hypothetical protein